MVTSCGGYVVTQIGIELFTQLKGLKQTTGSMKKSGKEILKGNITNKMETSLQS